MICLSLLNFSFSLCIVFLIFLNCPSVFSSSSLNFLRTAILNSLSGKLQISISLGSVLENYCFLLVVSCFLDLSYSFKLFSSHLEKQSSLTGFGKETASTNPTEDSEALFAFSMGTCETHFGLSLTAHFLRLCDFTQSHKMRLSADSLPVAFPSQCWMFKFVVALKPTELGFMHALTSCLQRLTFTTFGSTHREPVMRMCVGEVPGVLRVPGGHLGDPQVRCHSDLWAGFLMETMTWLVGSMSLERLQRVLSTAFPATAHPQSHSTPQWRGREKTGSPWQCAAQLRKLGAHSHDITFPLMKNHSPRRSLLALRCPALGEGDVAKVKLFLLASPVCPISDNFAAAVC